MKRTNPVKGLNVDPGWVEISWDEAIKTFSEKLGAIRKDDPRKLVWYGGFPSLPFFVGGMSGVFASTFGTPNNLSATGAMCSVHLETVMNTGSEVEEADVEFGKYILAMDGSVAVNNGSSDGGTDLVLNALEKGLHVVSVDPHRTLELRYGEWLPIRPGSDFPFLLAMTHVILYEIKKFDEAFALNPDHRHLPDRS